MADAKPSRPVRNPKSPQVAEPKDSPKIVYIGAGAENVKFTVDPKATLIRVYADGRILTDY